MKVLIIGANGFIGHSLLDRILATTAWEVHAIDLESDRIARYRDDPRLDFVAADITTAHDLVDERIRHCDVVLPLAATARPAEYVRNPLEVFELDFEENLRIVRQCARHGKRLIFPSTSEVYGMCPEDRFNEATSQLVLGPIHRQRWIYASAKQLLDRLIWAYGERGLPFTLFRPFNWFGPNLDRLDHGAAGGARVVTQFLGHLLRGEAISLVGGGGQRRCFTYIDDGIDGLMAILRNPGGRATGEIFNFGNPANECTVRELANLMLDILAGFPGYEGLRETAVIQSVDAADYYGPGYEDMNHRMPDIGQARRCLGWEPRIPLRQGLTETIAFYLSSQDSPRESVATI